MYICHELELIYIRIPKTGSNSFIKSMSTKYELTHIDSKKAHSEHFTALQTKKYVDAKFEGDVWNEYKKIVFIRYPRNWVRSIYCLREIKSACGEDNTKPFSEFVRNLKLTEFSFFTDEFGKVMVDNVYTMERDLETILHKYGVRHSHINKTPLDKLNSVEVTPEDKVIIDEKLRRELEYY